jgi:hypothetical protein
MTIRQAFALVDPLNNHPCIADFGGDSAYGQPETDCGRPLRFRTHLPLFPHLGALEGRIIR